MISIAVARLLVCVVFALAPIALVAVFDRRRRHTDGKTRRGHERHVMFAVTASLGVLVLMNLMYEPLLRLPWTFMQGNIVQWIVVIGPAVLVVLVPVTYGLLQAARHTYAKSPLVQRAYDGWQGHRQERKEMRKTQHDADVLPRSGADVHSPKSDVGDDVDFASLGSPTDVESLASPTNPWSVKRQPRKSAFTETAICPSPIPAVSPVNSQVDGEIATPAKPREGSESQSSWYDQAVAGFEAQ